jgi:ribosome-binding factor A
MTSVTSVDVNRDLSMAKVHISVLGTDEERENTLEALRSAATRLRMEISQRIVIRKMPRLSFFVDDTMQSGADIEKLIDQAMSEDSRRYSDREGK